MSKIQTSPSLGERLAILALFLIAFSSCSRANSNESTHDAQFLYAAPTAQQEANLLTFLESYNLVGSADFNRPVAYDVEQIIPRIHPWLKVGIGLKPGEDGGYQTFILKPLNNKIVSELSNALYNDNFPVPLLILRASFWTRAQELQAQGFRIGFKKYVPGTTVVGAYIDETKTLLFDTFAEYGTLTHEYEHYLQYQKLKTTRSADLSSSPLSDSCISAFGRFLGEVDATTKELPEWVDVFKTYDFKPESERDLKEFPFGAPISIFYSQILAGNLSYPSFAAGWVRTSDCPKSILDTAVSIAEKSSVDLIAASEIVSGLDQLHAKYNQAVIRRNTVCSEGFSTKAQQNTCDFDKQFFLEMDASAVKLNASINNMFKQLKNNRTQWVMKQLNALPEDYRRILCGNSLAYSFLGDCE